MHKDTLIIRNVILNVLNELGSFYLKYILPRQFYFQFSYEKRHFDCDLYPACLEI